MPRDEVRHSRNELGFVHSPVAIGVDFRQDLFRVVAVHPLELHVLLRGRQIVRVEFAGSVGIKEVEQLRQALLALYSAVRVCTNEWWRHPATKGSLCPGVRWAGDVEKQNG